MGKQVHMRVGFFMFVCIATQSTLLFHLFPVYEPLSLAVELHGEGDDLALVGLERFGVLVGGDLLLGGGDAAVVGEFQFKNIDDAGSTIS